VFKLLNPKSKGARIPEGLRFYVIGDIHGCADQLGQVLERIDEHLALKPVHRPVEVFLGDYIDRGPRSREVLDHLIARSLVRETVCLKGNHETYVDNFLNDPATLAEWRHYGGLQTLVSYGLSPSANMDLAAQTKLATTFSLILPENHRRFLDGLMSSFTCGDYFFVHAGARPGVPLPKQREEDLLWIRDDFLISEEDFGKIIVHGHTPVPEPEIRLNRINVDTGAYATGQLTCLVLEGDKVYFV
jgi:serine/threonine protein phosphatase 1